MSSMLPYTFFFIPEARVAIQPPNDENSEKARGRRWSPSTCLQATRQYLATRRESACAKTSLAQGAGGPAWTAKRGKGGYPAPAHPCDRSRDPCAPERQSHERSISKYIYQGNDEWGMRRWQLGCRGLGFRVQAPSESGSWPMVKPSLCQHLNLNQRHIAANMLWPVLCHV